MLKPNITPDNRNDKIHSLYGGDNIDHSRPNPLKCGYMWNCSWWLFMSQSSEQNNVNFAFMLVPEFGQGNLMSVSELVKDYTCAWKKEFLSEIGQRKIMLVCECGLRYI